LLNNRKLDALFKIFIIKVKSSEGWRYSLGIELTSRPWVPTLAPQNNNTTEQKPQTNNNKKLSEI
jgi:hypothetical protein